VTPARTLVQGCLRSRALWRAPVALALSLATLPAAAQNPIWIEQLGTGSVDRALALTPDGSGGAFVGGPTMGSLAGSNAGSGDAWIARYDPGGAQLWIRQLGSSADEDVRAAAQDGAGGAYATGITGGSLSASNKGAFDVWIARYDGSGNVGWIRQLGTIANDFVWGAVPDGSGGVCVSGTTAGSLGGPYAGGGDAWLARYDGAGNQLWVRQLGTSAEDQAYAAAPDGAGGIYLGGFTTGNLPGPKAGGWDAWLARYDGAGNQLWIRQLGTSLNDIVRGAAPDGSGGVYVGGSTSGNLGGPSAGSVDAWLARYGAAGNLLWVRQLGTNKDESIETVAPDGSGGSFASGWTAGSLGGPSLGLNDAWLARYDGAGNAVWVTQIGTSVTDFAFAAALAGSGDVYVAGSTDGDLGGTSAGSYDAWFARFDGDCGASSTYCTASATSIPGCQAAIGSVGSPSLAAPSGFTISSGSVPGGKPGICFFGDNGPANIPFGTLGGQICVQMPVYRSKPKSSGGTSGACNGNFAFTLQDLIDTSPIVVPGAVIEAEIWARDPANPDTFLLSDGLQFTVCP
jgi:hypothetical protein